MESGKPAERAHRPNLNSPDMLTLKGHEHVRVDTRFVKLVVPNLSLLFPSSPPPRELPDQTRYAPDAVSLQAFRNSRTYPRHCYSILFSGFHTHRHIDELVVHELQSITMHPAPCFNHKWLYPRPILTSFARLCISSCSSGYRARMMRPRHATRRRTAYLLAVYVLVCGLVSDCCPPLLLTVSTSCDVLLLSYEQHGDAGVSQELSR